MVSAIISYNSVLRNMDKRLKYISKQPVVDRETKYYEENIRKVKNLNDFLKNDRLYNYAMKAYGLEEMIYAKGLMRKVLSDVTYAKKLTDHRYETFKLAFDFDTFGENATNRDEATTLAVSRYKRITLEKDIGDQNEGARLALYFKRRIDELVKEERITEKSWAYALLGDKALAKTIFTTLGIPESMGSAPIDAQKKMLEDRLSSSDIINPEKREKLLKRFLAMYDMENETQFNPALVVLGGAARSIGGISSDTLKALQSLKLGGR